MSGVDGAKPFTPSAKWSLEAEDGAVGSREAFCCMNLDSGEAGGASPHPQLDAEGGGGRSADPDPDARCASHSRRFFSQFWSRLDDVSGGCALQRADAHATGGWLGPGGAPKPLAIGV